MRGNILEKASRIVGSRDEQYGDPIQSWEEIATIASILTRKKLTSLDCILILKAVKLVRESYQSKEDNRIDECGYTLIQDMIRRRK